MLIWLIPLVELSPDRFIDNWISKGLCTHPTQQKGGSLWVPNIGVKGSSQRGREFALVLSRPRSKALESQRPKARTRTGGWPLRRWCNDNGVVASPHQEGPEPPCSHQPLTVVSGYSTPPMCLDPSWVGASNGFRQSFESHSRFLCPS